MARITGKFRFIIPRNGIQHEIKNGSSVTYTPDDCYYLSGADILDLCRTTYANGYTVCDVLADEIMTLPVEELSESDIEMYNKIKNKRRKNK